MAEFTFEDKTIYYEDYGAGEPLVVLNGIFMSCASWAAFVPPFSSRNRLILLDLIDQGKSDKANFEYSQELQMRVLLGLLDHLGLERIHILGISYGGEIALMFAVNYPQRVKRLVLSNTSAYTGEWLRDIGRSWEYAFNSGDGRQFFKTCIPIIYSPAFYEANYDWETAREEIFIKLFTKEIYEAFGRLTRSAENFDVRSQLKRIASPTLVVSSEFDYLTPFYCQVELAKAIGAGHVTVQNAGHALMYEKPNEFTALVLGFINLTENIRIL